MLIGYMRVSSESDRQSTDLQRDALLAAGVDGRHLFEDHASGATDDRPGLVKALAFVQPGDVLVVWKLDRLGRSLSHLLSIVNALKEKRWPSVRSPKAWIPRRRRDPSAFEPFRDLHPGHKNPLHSYGIFDGRLHLNSTGRRYEVGG